jgi:multicomponent Na+:H+ antiporter subunit G
MIDYAGYVLISVGIALDVVGSLALLRMHEVYGRLLAATKCISAGSCAIMLGVLCVTGFSATGIKALLCAALILVTAPVAAQVLSRAAYRTGARPLDAGTTTEHQGEA